MNARARSGRRPVVLMARSAAQTVLGEVERWARVGLQSVGSPYEAIAYPLSALVMRRPRSGAPCPLESAGLADLKAVVIADVALPPEEIKAFGTHNCHFAGDNLDATNAAFNAEIAARIGLAPKLEVHTKLHSHPFKGAAWLSGMDVEINALAPGAVRWRQRLGLEVALLQIAYPLDDPSKVLTNGARGIRWRIATFSCDPAGKATALGDVRIVADDHKMVVAARGPAYWQSARGRAWDDAQKRGLRDAGYGVSRGWLRRGWRRFLVQLPAGRAVCVCVPPDLAAERICVIEVLDATRNLFAPLPVPRKYAAARRLAALDLIDLVHRYRGRGGRRRGSRARRAPANRGEVRQ